MHEDWLPYCLLPPDDDDTRHRDSNEVNGHMRGGSTVFRRASEFKVGRDHAEKRKSIGRPANARRPHNTQLLNGRIWLLVTSDSMKEVMRGTKFTTNDELYAIVHQWRRDTPKEWYVTQIRKLPER
ncbi:hypothetical protein C0J52_26463 [Blattella germanica]|nr:hypothetical protein C0J52_26463 [Blattella germanica]